MNATGIWFSPQILSFLNPPIPVAQRVGRSLRMGVAVLEANARLLVGLYLLLSVGGIVLLAITGYLGGSMVYDHGVGTPAGLLPVQIGIF